MEPLTIRRMTREESEKAQWSAYDQIPRYAPIKWICKYLGKCDRTIAKYRYLLIEHSLEYQRLACFNGLENPVLMKRQVELIKELSGLFDEWRDRKVVLALFNQRHRHPADDVEEEDFVREVS